MRSATAELLKLKISLADGRLFVFLWILLHCEHDSYVISIENVYLNHLINSILFTARIRLSEERSGSDNRHTQGAGGDLLLE